MPAPPEEPSTTLSAPVVPIEMAWDGYNIWPCTDCLPWHVAVTVDPETNEPVVTGWHAIGRPFVHEVEADKSWQ